jgi:hypothetical protein
MTKSSDRSTLRRLTDRQIKNGGHLSDGGNRTPPLGRVSQPPFSSENSWHVRFVTYDARRTGEQKHPDVGAWMGVRTVKSTELFTERDGRRSDAPLHDPILASGEKAKAFAMTVASLRAQDWSDEEIREAFPGHAVPPIST